LLYDPVTEGVQQQELISKLKKEYDDFAGYRSHALVQEDVSIIRELPELRPVDRLVINWKLLPPRKVDLDAVSAALAKLAGVAIPLKAPIDFEARGRNCLLVVNTYTSDRNHLGT
jgi:hypothetical protein